MPLLAKELSLHPADLFSRPLEPQTTCWRWWVLYTRARAEKALARKLLARGISFFLPLYQRKWRRQARLRSSYLPLFPGYVFLQDDGDARTRVVETNLISRYLWVEDQEQLHADLVRVYRLIESGAPLAPEERLVPGTWVEVTSGSLTGTRGKILSRGKQLKFIVEVQFLQRGVSMEIEGWMIRPLTGERMAPTADPRPR